MNSQLNITDGLDDPALARERIAQLQLELQDRQDQISELYEVKQATEHELRVENDALAQRHQQKIQEMQSQMQSLNIRN